MLPDLSRPPARPDLFLHWAVFAALLASLGVSAYLGYSLGAPLRADPATAEPVLLRSVFYALAIITFPLAKLLRHIGLRLNQTMPTPTPAKSRYLANVVVSLALSESIGIYGLVLALLGDTLNSLWIFTFLAALAMFLYRPRASEYRSIVDALQGDREHRVDVR